jgi:hypothetical protein
MTQSHKCAFLKEGDECVGNGWCQYKLVSQNLPQFGPVFCGKDQILTIDELHMKEEEL